MMSLDCYRQRIRQIEFGENCPWEGDPIWELPMNICPILWHTLYPYFLTLVFNGETPEEGRKVCCPAKNGIDLVVKMHGYTEKFGKEVPKNWRDVIYAEVVTNHGDCDYEVGQIFLFPTFDKKRICPAGVYNVFPFLRVDKPKCIDLDYLRCPDWNETVAYQIE